MILLFPMGGTGQRLVDAGYILPKPLLPLHGKPLLEWALQSVHQLEGQYHYVVRKEWMLALMTHTHLPPGCWHVLLQPTPGPLQSVLQASGCLHREEELLICDCDSSLESTELAQAVDLFRKSGAVGGVTVRKTSDPDCSYAEIDSEWWVSQTREKDPFTSWSTTGPYWFRFASMFLQAAQKAQAAHHVSISPVYNYVVGRIKAVPVSSFRHFGTPQLYEAAQAII